jgi:hypothetical protein
MDQIVTAGLYITRIPYGDTPPSSGSGKACSTEQVVVAIGALQTYVAAADEEIATLARKAGLPASVPPRFSNGPWQAADANWFKANPERSHRLRPLTPGERFGFTGNVPDEPVPANHELQVLVRQVEPGIRVRAAFCRNLEVEIPDLEPLLHAMFDLVTNGTKQPGSGLTVQEVAHLARKYAAVWDARG